MSNTNDTESNLTPSTQAKSSSKSVWEMYLAIGTLVVSLLGNVLQYKQLQNTEREIEQRDQEILQKNREISQKDEELRQKDEKLRQEEAEVASRHSQIERRCSSLQEQVAELNGQIAQNNADFNKASMDLRHGRKGGPTEADWAEFNAKSAALLEAGAPLENKKAELIKMINGTDCPIVTTQLPPGFRLK